MNSWRGLLLVTINKEKMVSTCFHSMGHDNCWQPIQTPFAESVLDQKTTNPKGEKMYV